MNTTEVIEKRPNAPLVARGRLSGMLKNASASLIGNLISVPIQFLGFSIVARSLGPDVFGEYSFAQELTLFVVYAADAGLSIIATREMAQRRQDAGAIHGTLLRLKAYLSLACYLIILAVGAALSDNRDTFTAVAVLGMANLLLSYLFLASGVFRASARMGWESATGLFQPICYCLFVAIVAYSGLVPEGLLPMALARLASFLPVTALALFVACRLVPPRRGEGSRTGRIYLRHGLPIMLAMFTFDALLRMSILFLQAWSTAEQLSLFSVSARIVYSLWLIPYILSGAWLPEMARSVVNNDAAQFKLDSLRLTRILLQLSVPLAMVLYTAAEPIILLLFGESYRESSLILQNLTFSIPFLFLFYGMKSILEASNRQNLFYILVFIGLAIGLAANFLFVREGGAEGASWAYLSGLFTCTCLGYVFAARTLCWAVLVRSALRVAGAAITANFTLSWLMPVSLVLALSAAGAVYLASLFILREINSKILF